jgi:iron complex transport system substrate-binding protein
MASRSLAHLFVPLLLVASVVFSGAATTALAHSDHGDSTTAPVDTPTTECSFPVTVTDATGQTVTVEERPERIVALQPSVAQTLWEIGARDRVVGMPVNQYTAYLNGSRERTNVVHADDFNTDVETVVSLEPDLVLAPNVVTNETVGQLRDLGLTVYRFGYGRSLEDIYRKTNRTGRLLGECRNATAVVGAMQTRLVRVRRAVADQKRPRVLHSSGQYTAGNGTFVHDVIRLAGGRNIAAEAGIQGYKTISDEVVVERDPEWIVHTGTASDLADRAAYANTSAIRANQTVALDSNLLSQPAPRVVIPLTSLAKQLHPDATADVPVRWTPKSSGHETTSSEGATTERATEGTPGMPEDTPAVTQSAAADEDQSTPVTGQTKTYAPFPAVLVLLAVLSVVAMRRR